MIFRTALIVSILVVGLSACNGKPPEPRAAEASQKPQVAAPWDDMKKTEQRARDVQKTVDQQAAEQRKQLEAAEQ